MKTLYESILDIDDMMDKSDKDGDILLIREIIHDGFKAMFKKKPFWYNTSVMGEYDYSFDDDDLRGMPLKAPVKRVTSKEEYDSYIPLEDPKVQQFCKKFYSIIGHHLQPLKKYKFKITTHEKMTGNRDTVTAIIKFMNEKYQLGFLVKMKIFILDQEVQGYDVIMTEGLNGILENI